MHDADVFCQLLRAKLALGQYRLPDLAGRGPLYRADPLFEAAADLSDSLSLYENGTVGESVVREEALRTAALACQVYVATVRYPRAEESEDGHR